jgi:hypothetical protein
MDFAFLMGLGPWGLGPSPSHYGTPTPKNIFVYCTQRPWFPWDFASSCWGLWNWAGPGTLCGVDLPKTQVEAWQRRRNRGNISTHSTTVWKCWGFTSLVKTPFIVKASNPSALGRKEGNVPFHCHVQVPRGLLSCTGSGVRHHWGLCNFCASLGHFAFFQGSFPCVWCLQMCALVLTVNLLAAVMIWPEMRGTICPCSSICSWNCKILYMCKQRLRWINCGPVL